MILNNVIYVDGEMFAGIARAAVVTEDKTTVYDISNRETRSYYSELMAIYYGVNQAQKGDTILSDCKGLVDNINKGKIVSSFSEYTHIFENIFLQVENKLLTIEWCRRNRNKAGIYLDRNKSNSFRDRQSLPQLVANFKKEPTKLTKSKLKRALNKRQTLVNRKSIHLRIGSKRWKLWKENEKDLSEKLKSELNILN